MAFQGPNEQPKYITYRILFVQRKTSRKLQLVIVVENCS